MTIGLRQTASMADFFVRVNGAHQDTRKGSEASKKSSSNPVHFLFRQIQKVKSQKVYFLTFRLFFFSRLYTLRFTCSAEKASGKKITKSKSKKSKRIKKYTFRLFTFWLFGFLTFRLFFLPLNGLTFALLAAHVRPKRHPSKNQKVKKYIFRLFDFIYAYLSISLSIHIIYIFQSYAYFQLCINVFVYVYIYSEKIYILSSCVYIIIVTYI